jgi:broad specificity phosphatase PhoE
MQNKCRVIFFRHGQTDWNKEERIQGSTDIPLNSQGQAEAQILSASLVEVGIQHIVTSPLKRASETALVVSQKLGVNVSVATGLREFFAGSAEGKTKSELLASHGVEFWAKWRSVHQKDMSFNFPDGEKKSAVRDRAFQCLEEFINRNEHTCIGVSTHGGVLRYCAHALLEPHIEPIPIPNCASYVFVFERNTQTWTFEGSLEKLLA